MKKADNILLNVGMLILALAITMLNIRMNRHIKEQTYQELIQQYDTTTTYNKLVIYPKIKDMEEKLK